MLTNCLAACAHLTITFSETERDICEKNRHYIIPPCIRRPRYGASRQNIATPFGMEKLEWWPTDCEKIEDIYNGLDTIPACDRQTDRRKSCHGIYALCIRVAQ